jgi:aspartyl-tRNA(Asn)/glutamyl-tRNA(Gln) amidotransferase subunit A
VLSGQSHGELRAASLQGLRLLAPTNVVLDGMDSAVAAAWQRALSLLYAAGVQITEAVVPPFSELAQINAKGGFTPPRPMPGTAAISTANAAGYDPRVGTRILRGKDISAADLWMCCARQQWIARGRRRWPITT